MCDGLLVCATKRVSTVFLHDKSSGCCFGTQDRTKMLLSGHYVGIWVSQCPKYFKICMEFILYYIDWTLDFEKVSPMSKQNKKLDIVNVSKTYNVQTCKIHSGFSVKIEDYKPIYKYIGHQRDKWHFLCPKLFYLFMQMLSIFVWIQNILT